MRKSYKFNLLSKKLYIDQYGNPKCNINRFTFENPLFWALVDTNSGAKPRLCDI